MNILGRGHVLAVLISPELTLIKIVTSQEFFQLVHNSYWTSQYANMKISDIVKHLTCPITSLQFALTVTGDISDAHWFAVHCSVSLLYT